MLKLQQADRTASLHLKLNPQNKHLPDLLQQLKQLAVYNLVLTQTLQLTAQLIPLRD